MNLEHLNTSQKEAVVKTDGPVMILAGAGSGKTRTLVSRIQYLLDEKQVSPFRILAVTFSNKAAREMRERVMSDNQLDLGAIQITTFHSFCARVLRTEAQYLGLSRNFTIYDNSESKSIIKAILGKRGISQREIHPNEVQHYIDGIKNLGHYLECQDEEVLEEIDQDDLFFDFYKEYESELHKSNAVDFGGLITGVLNLFDNFPEVLARFQKRFHYLLVDEYQDTNRAQFKLINLLSRERKNICVVGDEDQSIYSWRGADIRNILDFEKIFPDASLIKLEQNYRSSKNIIEAASCVISQNQQRKGKELWTDNEQGDSIKIVECQDDRAEAEFVSQEVKKLVQTGVSQKEIAIFYRTNAQSRQIEDALRKEKIPYKVVAGIKFYERKEVKDLLCYLRLVVNDKDSLALTRIINTPTRGIGARTLRKIEDEAIKLEVSLWEIINLIVEDYDSYNYLKLSSKVRNGLAQFVHLIHEAKIMDENKKDPALIYEKLLHESGYYESLESEKTYEAAGRIENLEELFTAIKQFQDLDPQASLLGFLETITLDSEMEEENKGQEVSMMTIHGSKGLEYHYVFVCGMEENIFPSYQSLEAGEFAIEEERRLFYVAMTRAMKRLYISFAHGRMLWGSVRFNGASRFIDEIPEDYYEWESWKNVRSKRNKAFEDDFDFSQETHYVEEEVTYVNEPVYEHKFPKGTSISHQLYGKGKVIDVEGFDKDEKVVIKFKDGARKKFLVKFAPLEKI
ncbi:MAG: ATP-dependent DNA helicase PcrA [Halobacteriovoraceae bacterium]|nr:ATP-dependent DNA helicase PcrA [Halobacteriovoraceae bacterium]|tara:strand:- start:7211 stop:9430 length:2220 start_codon:yes stop_codon:yes gene_type:complete